ncbi:MAG: hypothetical protein B7Z51_10060 [Methyloversatilis sp. 12-65-5]|nr:MAG: hypothetical protein B7Z51_10060 [Methyloversatilis sp. 12-65-5]
MLRLHPSTSQGGKRHREAVMKGFVMMIGICVFGASSAALAASAALPVVHAGGAATVEAQTPFDAIPARSSDTLKRSGAGAASSDMAQDKDQAAHLARQYALHRSSLYLYNPGRIGPMARAPGGAAVEQ